MREAWKSALLSLCVVLALTGLSTLTFGQAVFGSIYGSVTDSNGAAVPGATVTITDVAKNVSFTETTNEQGYFNKQRLVLGLYKVEVKKDGFKTAVQESVAVNVDVSTQVTITLQTGQVSEQVTVTAEAPLLKADRADVATTFEQKLFTDLPTFDRNFTRFELLTPGAARCCAGWDHAASENPQGSLQINVNGQHFSGTSYQLDGTDNRDPILGIIVINPTLESVSEAKVTTQNYDAEFGMANAGVVTAQTKSGTNELHGSGFGYRRSGFGQARNPFTEPKSVPQTRWGQFGGSLGGTIVKNKLFYFGDYQGQRSAEGGSTRLSVPTALARTGDLSEYGVNIYDPLSGNQTNGTGRTQFVTGGKANVIPTARLSTQALNLLKLIPLPNVAGAGVENNFTVSGTQAFNTNAFNTRGDYYSSEKMHIFGRYSFAAFKIDGPNAFGKGGGAALGTLGGKSDVRNQSIAAGFDKTVSNNWLTDFRFGFLRYRVAVLPFDYGTQPAKDAGIPGLNFDNTFTSGLPQLNINGKGGFLAGSGLDASRCNCPLDEQEQQFQYVNNWTNTRGAHSVKFGTDLRWAQNLRVPSDAHRSGQLSFNNDRTSQVGGAGGGLGIATFLLGDTTFLNRYVSTATTAAERQKRIFFYGQDTWRVSPKLTLNYGLRWDLTFPETLNAAGNGGFFDIATGEIRVAGVGDIGSNGNIKMNYKNFAPRLGLSYKLSEKTVIRAGYGRSYDIGVFGSVFGHAVTQNLPVLAVQEVRGAGGNSFNAAFNLKDGPPQFTNYFGLNKTPKNGGTANASLPSNGRFFLPDGVFARIRPERMRLASVDAWNVTVQHQITNSISVEAAYVGNKGTHVFAGGGPAFNANQPTLVGFLNAAGQRTDTNTRKPFFQQFGLSQGLDYFCNCSSNNYNALQLKAEKRFSGGYSLLAHYTASRNYNFDGDYFPIDARVAYGPNDTDRTHVIVLTNLYELPVGKGKKFLGNASRAANLIVGGWQINQSTNLSSGLPFSLSYQNCGDDRDAGPCRVNVTGDVATGDGSLDAAGRRIWFTPASAVLAAPGATNGIFTRPTRGTLGTSGRNAFRGPWYWQTDLSLTKSLIVTERIRGTFHWEMFNFFNHVNLGQPNTCVDCSLGTGGTSGKIEGTAFGSTQRRMQFGL
ncbi:MAG: TonB-dependent receptor, partial [Acidobacteria bacterium]|nr:TonB-dependent receptor [Acidobacteriota bacterium]